LRLAILLWLSRVVKANDSVLVFGDQQRRSERPRLRLDSRSGIATYLQLVQQVRQAVLLGRLRSGDQLPTAREVCARLAINPNTVLKAYRDLEH
jgi:hypothetical protein